MIFCFFYNSFFGWLIFAQNFGKYGVDDISVIFFIVGFISGMAILTYALISVFTYTFQFFFAKNFKKLDEKFREKKLLLYAGKKGKYKSTAAGILLNDFDIISKDLREKLIRKFSDDNSNVSGQSDGHLIKIDIPGANISLILIMKYFNKISQDLRNEILKKFTLSGAKNDKELVSKILLDNFKSLPEELKNEIISKLLNENSSEISYSFSQILLKYFLDVPRDTRSELILNFSNSKYLPVLENTIKIILDNFFRIPSNVREQAILNYARNLKKCDPYYIKEIIKKYGKSLPPQMTDQLLKKL